MNSEERILQILDNSACLSKGQLVGYLKKNLYPEELRAVELHLAGCPLCNDALEGYEKLGDAESVLASIKMPVLPAIAPREKEKPKEKPKEQVVIAKPVKAEPVAVAAAAPQAADDHTVEMPDRGTTRLLRPLGIAAAFLIGAGAIWYFVLRNPDQEAKIAQNTETVPQGTDSITTENRKLAANTPAATNQPAAAPVAETPHKAHKDSLVARAAQLKEQEKTKQAAAPVAFSMQAETAAAPTADKANDEVSEIKVKEDAASEKRQRKTEDNMAAAKAATRSADLKESGKKDNDKPQSDYEKGLELYKQKQYASALLYFRSAESDDKDPRHWDAVYYSALCNKGLNKKRRAIKQFQRVIDAGASQRNAAQKQINELKGKEE